MVTGGTDNAIAREGERTINRGSTWFVWGITPLNGVACLYLARPVPSRKFRATAGHAEKYSCLYRVTIYVTSYLFPPVSRTINGNSTGEARPATWHAFIIGLRRPTLKKTSGKQHNSKSWDNFPPRIFRATREGIRRVNSDCGKLVSRSDESIRIK